MDQFVMLVYLVLIAAPISTILHELGHLLGAKAVHAEKMTLQIGLGKPLISRSCGNVDFIIHRVYFVGGMTKSERTRPYNDHEKIWITMLGPATNAVVAFVTYFFLHLYPSKYMAVFFMFNIWMAAGNLIPFRWKGSQTDGGVILQLLKSRIKK